MTPDQHKESGAKSKRKLDSLPGVGSVDLELLKQQAAILGKVMDMPHGVLFRGGAEYKIRRALLEEDLFEAVIGLPAKLFFGTGIPASILILNKAKPEERRGKVLFIDASPEGFYHEGSNRNFLRPEDILRIAFLFRAYAVPDKVLIKAEGVFNEWMTATEQHHKQQLKRAAASSPEVKEHIEDEHAKREKEFTDGFENMKTWFAKENPGGRTSLEKFAAVVPLEEIAGENDFNLNISRYVDSSDPPPQLDVAEELKKLRDLEAARNAAEAKMNDLLKELGYEA